jgi:hypothetical protein
VRFGVILRRLRSHIVLQLNIQMLCPHQPALAPDGHGYALHQGALQRAHGAQFANQSAQQFIKLGRVFMRQQQLAAQHAVAPGIGAGHGLPRAVLGPVLALALVWFACNFFGLVMVASGSLRVDILTRMPRRY